MSEVKYRGSRTIANTERRHQSSGNIWADCPWQEINNGIKDGVTFIDDFVDFWIPGTQTTAIAKGRYVVFSGAGAGVWKPDAMPSGVGAAGAGNGGIISNLVADGSAAAIGTASCPFSLATTQVGKLWFEARIAYTSILTNSGQIFVGLGETAVTTYSVTIPLGNANATSNALAMIGFNHLEDGLAVLNTSYADHATSWTDIQAAANASPLTQLAANTWIKLGMKVDFADANRCVRFYVNNIECSTAMTKAALLATTYLDAVGLGPLLAVYGDSEGSDYIYMDWWKAAQIFE